MKHLHEDSRRQLISKSKSGAPYAPSNQALGRNRYERRTHSKFSKSVKSYNALDMNKLFKQNILDVAIDVNGETDDYKVVIKFGGFLDELQKLAHSEDDLNLRTITRSLINAFNRDDVYIFCTCPDWQYRFSYWATVKDLNSGQPENRPAKITNPQDNKGPGCKHVMLVLSNNTWLVKVSSVVNNYINYMRKNYPSLYSDIIYPAIFNEEYTQPVQLDIETSDAPDKELKTDTDELDIANKWARTRGQFSKGNDSGIRFASKDKPLRKQIDFDSLISDAEK